MTGDNKHTLVIHKIADELLKQYPLKTNFIAVRDIINEVITSLHKRTEGLSKSKVKLLMHAKLKILLSYFLENTEEHANVINQSYGLMEKIFRKEEIETFNNLIHLKWREGEEKIKRYNVGEIDINEKIPVSVEMKRYFESEEEEEDNSADDKMMTDENEVKSDDGEVVDGDDKMDDDEKFTGLDGIENSDLSYLPEIYRNILEQVNKPKLTYQIIKVIKLQYSRDYRQARDILAKILVNPEETIISLSKNTGLPVPAISIIHNELILTDLLSHTDDTIQDPKTSNYLISPNYNTNTGSTLIQNVIQETSDERNFDEKSLNLTVRCKKFIRSLQTYGPCTNPSQINLKNDKLTLVERGIFTRALAYLLDQNELDQFPLEDPKILGHISQQRYGILLQFAIAVQNVIKIDENFLNLSKKRSKAIKFITDCLTVAGTG